MRLTAIALCALLPVLGAAGPARADHGEHDSHAYRSPLVREYTFSDDQIEGTLVVPSAPAPAAKPIRPCPEGSVAVTAPEREIPIQQAISVQEFPLQQVPPQQVPPPQLPPPQAAPDIDTSAAARTVCVRGELPRDDTHAFAGDGLFRPPIEWSTWFRAAYGLASHRSPVIARSTEPLPTSSEREGTWDLGLGIEASLSASQHGDVRLGAWIEQRGFSAGDTFVGGELVATRVPRRVDMFLYEGHGIASLRVGRSKTAATASLAWGYMAPFWLEGPCRMRFYDIYTGVCHPRPERLARYIAGVRLVGTVTRAIDDPHQWSATLGLEFEPAGALRMFAIARSWYRN